MRAFLFVLFLAVIQCLDFCETKTSRTLVSFYTCNVHHRIIKMANFLSLFRADKYIINVMCLVNFMDFVLGLNKYVAYQFETQSQSHESFEHSIKAVKGHESCCKLCCNPNNELTTPSDPVL